MTRTYRAQFVLWLSFLVLSAVCARGASQAHDSIVIFHDDFESYSDTHDFRKIWHGGAGTLRTNAPGGGQAIQHSGRRMSFRKRLSAAPSSTHNLLLSADFYDFATNTQRGITVALTNSAGQVLAIGFGAKRAYVARATGFTAKTNWISFRRGQAPIPGWHHMEALLSLSNVVFTLDLQSDGKIDKRLRYALTGPAPKFNTLCFGGEVHGKALRTPALVDNVRVELLPVSSFEVALHGPPFHSDKLAAAREAARAALARAAASSPSQAGNLAVAATASSRPSNGPVAAPVVAASTSPSRAPVLNTALWLIVAALAVILGLLGYMLSVLRRATRRPKTAGVPLLADTGATSENPPTALLGDAEDEWRARAENAEALAAKQARILKEKVGPELVEFAKGTLVQGLYKQRTTLLQTQARAEQALNDLEKKLAELELPARERILAYEKRIAELEKDLGTRADEMRELTRATLALVRKRMQEERESTGQTLN